MKLLAVTYGTEGDTRPLAVLCHGLMQAGHDVLLLADAGTLGSARDLGVPHAALGQEIRTEVVALLERGNSMAASAAGLARIARQQMAGWLEQIHAAAHDCDAILAGGLAAPAALAVGEHRERPCIGIGMIPITPTRSFPSPFLPVGGLPAMLNRASHHLVNRLIWNQFRAPLRRARAVRFGVRWPMAMPDDHPMLYGVSRCLVPAPDDWPDSALICGQWSLPAVDSALPEDLETFLADGPAPVFVGFGSMVGFDRRRVLDALLDGLSGQRVLLSPGWSGLPAGFTLPPTVHLVGDVLHASLFPRTAGVIHHGGSGTTHTACRAGVPSVIMPCAADQSFWARRLHALRVAPAPLIHQRLRSSDVASALEVLLDADTQARARQLGACMAHEDGVATAVRAIERQLASLNESADVDRLTKN